jgi:hypothetical protein
MKKHIPHSLLFLAAFLFSCAPESIDGDPFTIGNGRLTFVCSITWADDDKVCAEVYNVDDPNALSEIMNYCTTIMLSSGYVVASMNPDGTWKNCPSEGAVLTCDESFGSYNIIPIKVYYYGDYYRGETCASYR